MCSIVDGNEFNDRFEYDIEKRYFIDDQINLEYDIKSLGLKIAKLNFEVNWEASTFQTLPLKHKVLEIFFKFNLDILSKILSKNDIQPKFYNNHIGTKKGVGHVSIVYRNGKHNILARPEIKEINL